MLRYTASSERNSRYQMHLMHSASWENWIIRPPDLATGARTWLKDNKETGMSPPAQAKEQVRRSSRPSCDPRRHLDDLVHLPVSGGEDRKLKIPERSRYTVTNSTALHAYSTATAAGLRGAASHHHANDDPNLSWTTGRTFDGFGILDWYKVEL